LAGFLFKTSFVHLTPGVRGVTVPLYDVVRQQDPVFLATLAKIQAGTVDDDAVSFLKSRFMESLSPAERLLFEHEALYIMPRWKRTVPITVDYLRKLGQPVAKLKAQYSSPNGAHRVNHAVKDINLPATSALAKGAIVMLLLNQIVEKRLSNGSIGTVVKIVYRNAAGPRESGALPLYVIVDFPDADIAEEDKFFPDLPRTCIPIEPVTLRCEKKCCSVTTVPLRVCKAITIHKAQGISIGPGNVWERVVIALPEARDRKTPALELVALSRATEPGAFAISCDAEITKESLLNMGRGKAYDQRREFEAHLRDLAAESQVSLRAEIIAEDPNQAAPTLEGGFHALVCWFRESVAAHHQDQEAQQLVTRQ
jgi:hypothetical protein